MSDDDKTTQGVNESIDDDAQNDEPETFPAEHVKELREENAKRRRQLRETEEQLKDTRKRLEAIEAQAATKQEQELAEQGKYKDLLEKREKELADIQAKMKATELSNMRLKIANELGIPVALAERLRGDNEDELREDADKLMEVITPPDSDEQPTRARRQTTTTALPDGTPVNETAAQRIARRQGRNILGGN